MERLFSEVLLKPAFGGGFQSAASYGIGFGFGGAGGIGKEIARGAAHAISSGIQSGLQGGDFLQGFASGGVSSGVGSALSGSGAVTQIAGGGISGGIGAELAGGNFFQGFGQGIAVSAFNHALHSLAIMGGHIPPPSDKILPGFSDAEYQGYKGGRHWWKLDSKEILEWDYQHGEVEKYDKTGKNHKGAYDPHTGTFRGEKSIKPGRTASSQRNKLIAGGLKDAAVKGATFTLRTALWQIELLGFFAQNIYLSQPYNFSGPNSL
jgi:hypothetical protein